MILERNGSFWGSQYLLVVLWVLFLIRGLIHLTVLPPLEGFDSIGHIDYLQYIKDHEGKRNLGDMPFSSRAETLIRTLPSNRNLRLAPIASDNNTITYEDYFKLDVDHFAKLKELLISQPYDGDGISYSTKYYNWQDKHPPLYYRIVNFFVDLFYPSSFFNGILIARLISLAILSLTIPVLFYWSRWLDKKENRSGRNNLSLVFPMLFIAQSMIYIIGCRISNDALAIPLNAFALALIYIWIGTQSESRNSWVLSIVIGIIVGVSTITKAYALILFLAIPIMCIYLSCLRRSWMPILQSILMIFIALIFSFQTLAYHQKMVNSLDGSKIAALSYSANVLETFIEMYFQTIVGYLQFFRMLVIRVWIGNWSSLGNYLPFYLLYSILIVFLVINFIKNRTSLFKFDNNYETNILLFSLLIQLLMIAALVNLGVKLYIQTPEAKNLVGYYSYAFFSSELVILWQGLGANNKIWPWMVLITFMLIDFGGLIAQILFYFGAGHIGPVKMVIPVSGWFLLLVENWEKAPWTFISLPVSAILALVYYTSLPSLLFAFLRQDRTLQTNN